MPGPTNILNAMFDIRPVKSPGAVDFGKVTGLKKIIDLKIREKPVSDSIPVLIRSEKKEEKQNQTFPSVAIIRSLSVNKKSDKELILGEIQRAIGEATDVAAELTSFGAKVFNLSSVRTKPRLYWQRSKVYDVQRAQQAKGKLDGGREERELKPVSPELNEKIENFWLDQQKGASDYVWPQAPASAQSLPIESEVSIQETQFASTGAREMEFLLSNLRQGEEPVTSSRETSKPTLRDKKAPILLAGLVLLIITLGLKGGFNAKESVVKSGNQAVVNLQTAKADLINFDFLSAADSFALAYDNFGKASEVLNYLGANFLSSFASVPGLGALSAANDLAIAGQGLSRAGQNLSLAVENLSKINFAAGASLADPVNQFKTALMSADIDMIKAGRILADIDPNILPEDKRPIFVDFKEKIPEFQKYIGEAVDYANFLLAAAAEKDIKKYIILFQNNSELRATGGFPGSYALLVFEKGLIKSVTVDDIYNIDGQLRENIIPPVPLQHITPNWGMRDANWFADFPASARKVEEMYRKDGGPAVDGVLAITPDVISGLLKITGPIRMTKYGVEISADNFLTVIQKEVEYGENRAQPKTILKDLQPQLFSALTALPKERWAEVFKLLLESVRQKHILAFFNDPDLENSAIKFGVGGEIKKSEGDYLQVVFSNIKGSKSDAVTENEFELSVADHEDSGLYHRLVVDRYHQGGGTPFGFYNRTNSSYVRIYLPKGAVLKSIQGHSLVDYRPLLPHADFNFKKDPDLENIEAIAQKPFAGVDQTFENGKTVIGFWLLTRTREQKSVTLEYYTPKNSAEEYSLYWQKQSGTPPMTFSFNYDLPTGFVATLPSDQYQFSENKVRLTADLDSDQEIKFGLR
jgi:hypothetical protein